MIAKRISPVIIMRRVLTRFGIPGIAAVLLVAGLLLACPSAQLPASAQASALENGPPPPPPEDGSPAPPPNTKPAPAAAPSGSPLPPEPPPPPPEPSATPAEAAAPPAPVFDPLHAKRSLDVGTFYLKKGDYDAAIDRFQEAARLQPGLAKPFLYLGEAYEKKNDPANAATAYRKYLDLYRTAPDRDKLLKRIEKLETEAGHDDARRGSG